MAKAALTPRERVVRNLARQEADRPAFSWSFGPQPPARAALDAHLAAWGLDYPRLYDATCDVRSFSAAYVGPGLPPRTSPWGWTTRAVSYGAGAYDEFDHLPLARAESVADVERHPWPDARHFDAEGVGQDMRQDDPNHRYARVLWGGNPLEILMWIMGLEKVLVGLVAEPAMIDAALERITSIFEAILRRSLEGAAGEADAVYIADDVGTQNGPMMSPATYRARVKPYHARLCRVAHEHGLPAIHHSDGSVAGLLYDLIDAGVDCLEAVQTECRDMAPESLKARFGTRLAFQGGVSVQQVLPRGTEADVRRHVRHLKATLGRGGGYICAPSHAIQAGTPPENVVAMVEEGVEKTLAEIAHGKA